MNYFQWSNQSFNIASVFYFFAFVLYAGKLASKRKIFKTYPSYAAAAAYFFHTSALILRWVEAGIGHPPWTNLYESLVFFSWGVMGAHLFFEYKFKFKLTGVFASAVVFCAMGIASLHPNKAIEPLVPALQSWWLLFHVFMACIAYAFFLGSSFVSVFYLLREKIRLETMAAVAAVVCLVFLAISAGKTFFLTGEIQFFKVAQNVIMNFKGPDGKPMQEFVPLVSAKYFLFPMLLLYLGSAIGLYFSKKKQITKAARVAFVAALALHLGLIVLVFLRTSQNHDMSLKSNPYRVAGFIMTFGIAAFFAFLFQFKNQVLEKLPSLEVLDRLGYETILIGVPFMTLNLVSGAVWAYYAWGRYWGWDPKETWALITWFIYVIYMHMRVLAGWKGRRTALISLFGFFVVIFTYLGVNLVISGLHSYATG